MVSTKVACLTAKPFENQLLLPIGPPDALPSDCVGSDFSDVFGPIPVRAPLEVGSQNSKNSVIGQNANESLSNVPAVIHTRSHSLVGPSSCTNQLLNLSKLTLHEPDEDSLEFIEGEVGGEPLNELIKPCVNDTNLEKSIDDEYPLKERTVGLEDFEVLKVVGQGAFAKVYQVRRCGTSEIYAMKVMRKDKIMEKNHSEYMKSERDILTKVDHPFIVQLRYSFQVMNNLPVELIVS